MTINRRRWGIEDTEAALAMLDAGASRLEISGALGFSYQHTCDRLDRALKAAARRARAPDSSPGAAAPCLHAELGIAVARRRVGEIPDKRRGASAASDREANNITRPEAA